MPSKPQPRRRGEMKAQVVHLDFTRVIARTKRSDVKQEMVKHVRNTDAFTGTVSAKGTDAQKYGFTVKKKGFSTRARKTGMTKQLVSLGKRVA